MKIIHTLLLLSIISSSCRYNSGTSTVQKDSIPYIDTSENAKTIIKGDDMDFAIFALSDGLEKVEASRLAEEQGSKDEIRSLGSMMIADHNKANEALQTILKGKELDVPGRNRDHQEEISSLAKQVGKGFDESYIDLMIGMHKKAIQQYEKAANQLVDDDLKGFAREKLPALKHHLEETEAIKKAL